MAISFLPQAVLPADKKPVHVQKERNRCSSTIGTGTNPRNSAGLRDFPGADAGGANFLADHDSVLLNANALDVGFERARGNFHDVHADPAFFLGQTSPNDGAAMGFLFAADFTYIAHFFVTSGMPSPALVCFHVE